MAIQKDPNYGRAYAWRACATSGLDSWTRADHWDDILSDSRRALELDDKEAECHRIKGSIALPEQDLANADHHFRRALELNPNSPWILGRMGDLYCFLGDGAKALEYQNQAKKLDPFVPIYIREIEAIAHYLMADYAQAVAVVQQCLHKTVRAHAYLVASLSRLNDDTATTAAVQNLLAARPDFTIDSFVKTEIYRDPAALRNLGQDLANAGLEAGR